MSVKLITFIAFIRGINVGGANKLPMADLRQMCEDIGLENVRTYIQSGNVIFESELDAPTVIEQLEVALEEKMGKPILVSIRTADELASVLDANPFPDADPAKVGVMFFKEPVDVDPLSFEHYVPVPFLPDERERTLKFSQKLAAEPFIFL